MNDWLVVGGSGSFIKMYLEDTNNKNFEIINVIEESTGFAQLKKN